VRNLRPALRVRHLGQVDLVQAVEKGCGAEDHGGHAGEPAARQQAGEEAKAAAEEKGAQRIAQGMAAEGRQPAHDGARRVAAGRAQEAQARIAAGRPGREQATGEGEAEEAGEHRRLRPQGLCAGQRGRRAAAAAQRHQSEPRRARARLGKDDAVGDPLAFGGGGLRAPRIVDRDHSG
jgi:hypothetical protein